MSSGMQNSLAENFNPPGHHKIGRFLQQIKLKEIKNHLIFSENLNKELNTVKTIFYK
jgi:hypothetical protein